MKKNYYWILYFSILLITITLTSITFNFNLFDNLEVQLHDLIIEVKPIYLSMISFITLGWLIFLFLNIKVRFSKKEGLIIMIIQTVLLILLIGYVYSNYYSFYTSKELETLTMQAYSPTEEKQRFSKLGSIFSGIILALMFAEILLFRRYRKLNRDQNRS